MLLGIRSKKTIFLRHLFVAILSALLVYLFYISYFDWGVERALWPDWGADHPYWRSWAHAAFVLLFFTLILGPAAKLYHPLARFIPWRRELGIWFAVLATGHAYAIWDRWAQRDWGRLFGFEYMQEVGSYVMVRPEVGIMNMMGLMVAPMIILLVLTSSDKAVSFLGISSWKWLHNSLTHAIFYILMLRGILYFFFFFQASPPDWKFYPPIWFLYVFLGMGVFAVLLQAAAFAKTVLQQRSYSQKNSWFQIVVVIVLSVLFVTPMALATSVVVYFDNRVIKEAPTFAKQAPAQNYSQNFHMIIREANKDIFLWVNNIDTAPNFRQTIEVAGAPISHQIYRYSERTLYEAKLNADGKFAWTKVENVSPEDIGLTQVAAGPGAWATQLGIGEHQIPLAQGGSLKVSIINAGELISDEVFALPEDANPVPALLRQNP